MSRQRGRSQQASWGASGHSRAHDSRRKAVPGWHVLWMDSRDDAEKQPHDQRMTVDLEPTLIVEHLLIDGECSSFTIKVPSAEPHLSPWGHAALLVGRMQATYPSLSPHCS